jgi:hypothetical protein
MVSNLGDLVWQTYQRLFPNSVNRPSNDADLVRYLGESIRDLRSYLTDAQSQLAASQERERKLREALEPFAAVGRTRTANEADGDGFHLLAADGPHDITFKDCTNAANVLKETEVNSCE